MQAVRRNWARLLLLALGLGWIWASRAPDGAITSGQISAPQAGFLAPDFQLNTPEGASVSLADFRGQVVLVNIWATWCPPCRAEMPAIQRAYEAYRAEGFVVLAVNSTMQDEPEKVPAFIKEYGLTFSVLMDRDGRVTRIYQVKSLPSSFFIGRNGVISEVVIGGPMDEALLKTRIESLLKEKP